MSITYTLNIHRIYPCISRLPIFDGQKSNFLISLSNVHGILILYSSISGTVDTQKKSVPQVLSSFVAQQLLYIVYAGILSLSFKRVFRKSNM